MLLAAGSLAACGLVTAARAADPGPPKAAGDSTATVAPAPRSPASGDSIAIVRSAPDPRNGGVVEVPRPPAGNPVARGAAPEKPRFFDQPRWVMVRSLIVPGWGQFHNHAWIKALGVSGAEAALGLRMLDDGRALDRLNRDVVAARQDGDVERENAAVAVYNDRLNQLIAREWLLAGLLTYAMLDAYVDAHFRHFDIEFRRDPALPGGGAPAAGLTVGWRSRF